MFFLILAPRRTLLLGDHSAATIGTTEIRRKGLPTAYIIIMTNLARINQEIWLTGMLSQVVIRQGISEEMEKGYPATFKKAYPAIMIAPAGHAWPMR